MSGEPDPPDPINLSALNQYAYCPRRCALIYLEGEFAQNIHTARGNAEHARVDRAAHVSDRDGARVEYALPVWSEQHGLIGKCDVVEIWPDGTLYPVEYKHGPRRKHLNDDLQLAGQALCLAEMFGREVSRGAIFHVSSHHRREVSITAALREQVLATAAAVRALLSTTRLPPPLADRRRCDQCSLQDICEPTLSAAGASHAAARAVLFDPAMD